MSTKSELTKENAIEVMKNVRDPELGLDIWTLGLIYIVDLKKDNRIYVEMTFTSPMCPFGPQIVEELKNGLEKAGFNDPEIEVIFDPPWTPNEELRAMLGV